MAEYGLREIHIPNVGGPFQEVTEVPPWEGTSAQVWLNRGDGYRDETKPPLVTPTLLATTILFSFGVGLAMGMGLPAWLPL